jgi:hypothetical protein
MTKEAFLQLLDRAEYSYEIDSESIIVTNIGDVNLNYYVSIPPNVKFKNVGSVYLSRLKSLPPNTHFLNTGYLDLGSITSLHQTTEFSNGGEIHLESLVGGWFDDWTSNIDAINNKKLLNLMTKKGVFV